MINFNLERFKKLPRQPGVIWQGGVFKMPAWFEDDDGKPFRSQMAMWAAVRDGTVSKPVIIEEGEPYQAALDAMIDFALAEDGCGHRPYAIEVTDTELASFLEQELANSGTRVDCVANLPVARAFLEDLAGHMNKREEPPCPFTGKGVGVEQMKSFAEAAAAFYKAHPWNELTGEDLILVKQPDAPASMQYVCVMGHSGQTYGLGFFNSIKQFEKMNSGMNPGRFFARDGAWSLTFDAITNLPFADVDIWEVYQLRVAGEQAYPLVMYFGPKKQMRRPTANELGFIEGLLHAIAETTTDQLDQGIWNRTVRIGGRAIEYSLALVDAMEQGGKAKERDMVRNPHDVRRAMEKGVAEIQRMLSEQEFDSIEDMNEFLAKNVNGRVPTTPAARSDVEHAQQIMYEAWDATGRRRRMLARKALEISPNCADAYVLLAEESGSPSEACTLLQKGVAAGERALGPSYFKKDVGHFWGLLETRPYMRARHGLAQCLWALGRKEEAVSHYEELIRLNPGDNQGVRYELAACLLDRGEGDKLEALFQQYKDESSAQWHYVRALWVYRKEGDSKAARKLAKDAIKCNAHVPAFLSGDRKLPREMPDSYRWGHEDEAKICAAELGDKWKSTPGAVEWLTKQRHSRQRSK